MEPNVGPQHNVTLRHTIIRRCATQHRRTDRKRAHFMFGSMFSLGRRSSLVSRNENAISDQYLRSASRFQLSSPFFLFVCVYFLLCVRVATQCTALSAHSSPSAGPTKPRNTEFKYSEAKRFVPERDSKGLAERKSEERQRKIVKSDKCSGAKLPLLKVSKQKPKQNAKISPRKSSKAYCGQISYSYRYIIFQFRFDVCLLLTY